MARALNPARLDQVGWYLVGNEVDLSRRLKRRYESQQEVVQKIEQEDATNADRQPRSEMDLDDLDSGSVANKIDSPVFRSKIDSPVENSGSVASKIDSPVENYYFSDAEDSLTSLVELQLDGEKEPGRHQTLVLNGKRNSDSYKRDVKTWRVEFDHGPVLFAKDLDDNWIQLSNPLPLYEKETESVFCLLDYLSSIKRKISPSPSPIPGVLQKHSDLVKKLAARDSALKETLELQSLVKKRKAIDDEAGPSKRLKEKEEVEEEVREQMDDEVGDGMQGAEEDGDELGESICAVCDDGGNLLCCDGPCLRSFHSECLDTLKVPYAHLKQSSFYCRNCSLHQHQCFECGRLGSSYGTGQDVFLCDVAFCGRFYHRYCVSRLLGGKNVEIGFVCPLHSCNKCRGGEGEDPSEWLYECRRCPRAWHRKCVDDRILFGEGVPGRRGWMVGKTRFLYCMQHSLDPNIQTPKRNHLAFPPSRPEVRTHEPAPVQNVREKQKPASPAELKAIEDPVLAMIEESKRTITPDSVVSKLCRPQTVGSTINGLCHMNMICSQIQALQKARECLKNGGTVQDVRRICPVSLFKKFKDAMKVYLSPLLYGMRYSTFGRHFTVTEKLRAVVDRLCWYIAPGDLVADLCCGANEFSRLLSTKMAEMKIACRFKNFDVFQPIDTFCFERRDYTTIQAPELGDASKLIIGLNPPFGVNASLASKFAALAASFSPKIIILIAPKETMRLEKHGYDLIVEDKHLFEGNAFYFPGSIDATGKIISHENHDAPYLFLWSRRDWRVTHERIAAEKGHPRFGVEECPLDVVTEAFADSDQTRENVVSVERAGDQSRESPEHQAGGWIDIDSSSPQREHSEVVEPQIEPGSEESEKKPREKPQPKQEGRLEFREARPQERHRRESSRNSTGEEQDRGRSHEYPDDRARESREEDFYDPESGLLGAPPGYENYRRPPPLDYYRHHYREQEPYPPYPGEFHHHHHHPPPQWVYRPQGYRSVEYVHHPRHYRQPYPTPQFHRHDVRLVHYEDHFRRPPDHRYFYR